MNARVSERMDMTDIVAAAWNIYRHGLRLWLSLTLVSLILMFGIQLLAVSRIELGPNPSDDELQSNFGPLAAVGLAALAVWLFTHTALVLATASACRGQTIAIASTYLSAAKLYLPILIMVAFALVTVSVLTATLVLLPLAVFLAVSWSLLVQATAVEGTRFFGALRRSRQIVRGQWWRTLGIHLAILLLSILPGLVVGAITSGPGIGWLSALGAALGNVLAAPFVAIAQTLLYADLLRRKGEQPFATTTPEAA